MEIRKIEEELPARDIAAMRSTVCSDPLSVALPNLPESSSGNPLSVDIGGLKVDFLSQDVSYSGDDWNSRADFDSGLRGGNKSLHVGFSIKF